MITPGANAWVYLARGVTDMRKGIDSLLALANDHLNVSFTRPPIT